MSDCVTLGKYDNSLQIEPRESAGLNVNYTQKLIKKRSLIKPLKSPNKHLTSLLTLQKINKVDYQDEFMSHYDKFSESWRAEIDRNKRF